MSRLGDGDLVDNPVKHYISWKNIQTTKVIDGEEYKKITGGEFRYSTKNAEGEYENTSISMPFEFAILDKDTFSYKGNDKANNNRYIWTKEISKYTTGNQELRCKEGVLYNFDIADLRGKETKDKIKGKIREVSKDIDYTQSIYIAVLVDGQYEIWNMQLNGAALSGGNGDVKKKKPAPEDVNDGWFGFLKTVRGKELRHTIVVNDFKPKKIGDVSFMIPVFELGEPLEKDTLDSLDTQWQEVQTFLKAQAKYNESKAEAKPELATTAVETEKDPWDN